MQAKLDFCYKLSCSIHIQIKSVSSLLLPMKRSACNRSLHTLNFLIIKAVMGKFCKKEYLSMINRSRFYISFISCRSPFCTEVLHLITLHFLFSHASF